MKDRDTDSSECWAGLLNCSGETLKNTDLLSKTAFLNHNSLIPEAKTLLVIVLAWPFSFVHIKEKSYSQKLCFLKKKTAKSQRMSKEKVLAV